MTIENRRGQKADRLAGRPFGYCRRSQAGTLSATETGVKDKN